MKVIGHRGFGGLRVENTLAAFANAIELGADGAELDVHLSRDAQVIVHHDDTLNPAYCRHVGGNWLEPAEAVSLASLTYAELQRYDIGTPRPDTGYARRHQRVVPAPDQHIPLLRDVIRLVKARSSHFILVVEIKASPLEAARKPWVRLVDATLAEIDGEGFADRVILCSFDWGSLRYAMHKRPGLPAWFTTSPASWFGTGQPPPTDIPPDPAELRALRKDYAGGDAPWFAGFDPRRFDKSCTRAVAAAGGNAWFPFHRDFTKVDAVEAASLGLDSAVWSVNLRDAGEYARLADTGVGNLVCDYLPP